MSNAHFEPDGVMTDEHASILTGGTDFLMSYGWYLVGLGLFYLVYRDKIWQYYNNWYAQREDKKYAEKYHKNPDIARERMESIEAARAKMQEELDRKAREAEEKRKQKEEQKRLELLDLLEGKGHRLGGSSKSSSLKPEYNPLMGDASGSTYRPPKRSCCKKGGGCG